MSDINSKKMALVTAVCGDSLVTAEHELEMKKRIESGEMGEHKEYSEKEILEFKKTHNSEDIMNFDNFVKRHG